MKDGRERNPGFPCALTPKCCFWRSQDVINNLTNRDRADAGKGPGKLRKGFVAQAD